jgi:protein tyrosine phosphatase (PTP) superfamily phosphohydrolase (DUF442 family)
MAHVDRPPGRRGRLGHPRWARWFLVGLGAYLAVAVGFQLSMTGLAFALRSLGHDPRSDELGSVHNLRRVDEQVWAGAQPDATEYRELAAHGVRLVIDLRTGVRDDPHEDNDSLLRELGIERLAMPVPDGHVPSRPTMRRLVRAIDEADGLVFIHCGGGVGRSAAAQVAYLAASGRDPAWTELLALGPMTLEQMVFVAAARPGDPHHTNPAVRRVSEALDAPRRLVSRVGAWLH